MEFYQPLTEEDYKSAAEDLGVEVAAIKAISEVETDGRSGFVLAEDGVSYTPRILFERHKFKKFLESKGYDTTKYPSSLVSSTPGGYTKNNEHGRLQEACKIDRDCALMSASWGKFQVMGFNYAALGYKNLQDFINDVFRSEAAQLVIFAKYIKSNLGLWNALKNKDWAKVALLYNGSNYKINNYDTKLYNAYCKFKS